ncbi:CUB domain-containing protein 1a [Brachyhypopomus gauderio]|uniref:CUB domain-containing protein 1a n=1 Tax=Brachyhypopomus gauderio TaxID=698409 RepID=UPI00404217D9
MRTLGLGVVLLFGFFELVWTTSVSGGPALTINLQSSTTIHINRSDSAQRKCDVCIGSLCQSSVVLKNGSVSVVFSCLQPEDIFIVEIIRHIVCLHTCSGNITPEEYPSLQNFNRTFTWNVRALVQETFRLDFTKAGLQQIRPTESCRDKHVYSISAGTARLGIFCRHGTIKEMQVLNEGIVSLWVPGNRQMDTTTFGVSLGQQITSLAVINITLPAENSSQEFLSPNYPDSFPDDDVIMWTFHVPPKYYATMKILNHAEPRCRRKDVRLEYQLNGRIVVRKLDEAQLSEHPGPFNLSLQNCKEDVGPPSSGLSLQFRVSAAKRSSEVRCSVDLMKEDGLVIHIKKKKPTSACILKLNAQVQETVTIHSKKTSYLSFIDCLEQDLVLTSDKTVACLQQRDCQFSGVSLKVPALEKCLLGVLEQVTWHLNTSQHGAMELMSPMGGFQQLLPGQTCNGSALLTVSEDEPKGITVGQFCPQGPIQKVQIRVTNLTVSAYPNGNDLRQIPHPLLNVSFTKIIGERYIFTVLPKKATEVILATPAWPAGMRPHSTVSWIVTFPSKVEAHVGFTNISKLTCQNRNAFIKVQKQGTWDHLYSWKEDEKPKDVVVKESFYLNMSNCMPIKGTFGVVSRITLQTSKDVLVGVIVTVVILSLLFIVLTVACVIIRKKKQKAPAVSVYNPNGHVLLPGLHGIPQITEDEDFHIYHCIDDTLVYGHLLKDGMEINQFEEPVDVYRDFTRPMDKRPLTEEREVEKPEVGVYRPFPGFQDPPVVPGRCPQQEENLASKDQETAGKEISGDGYVQDQSPTTPDLQKHYMEDSEKEESEIQM